MNHHVYFKILCLLLIQMIIISQAFGAPADLQREGLVVEEWEEEAPQAGGRTLGHLKKFTNKPFNIASKWAHRVGYILDPHYVYVKPGLAGYLDPTGYYSSQINVINPTVNGGYSSAHSLSLPKSPEISEIQHDTNLSSW